MRDNEKEIQLLRERTKKKYQNNDLMIDNDARKETERYSFWERENKEEDRRKIDLMIGNDTETETDIQTDTVIERENKHKDRRKRNP